MSEIMQLENCAMCGGEASHYSVYPSYAMCGKEGCKCIGPSNDHDGEKWNKQQRWICEGKSAEDVKSLRMDIAEIADRVKSLEDFRNSRKTLSKRIDDLYQHLEEHVRQTGEMFVCVANFRDYIDRALQDIKALTARVEALERPIPSPAETVASMPPWKQQFLHSLYKDQRDPGPTLEELREALGGKKRKCHSCGKGHTMAVMSTEGQWLCEHCIDSQTTSPADKPTEPATSPQPIARWRTVAEKPKDGDSILVDNDGTVESEIWIEYESFFRAFQTRWIPLSEVLAAIEHCSTPQPATCSSFRWRPTTEEPENGRQIIVEYQANHQGKVLGRLHCTHWIAGELSFNKDAIRWMYADELQAETPQPVDEIAELERRMDERFFSWKYLTTERCIDRGTPMQWRIRHSLRGDNEGTVFYQSDGDTQAAAMRAALGDS